MCPCERSAGESISILFMDASGVFRSLVKDNGHFDVAAAAGSVDFSRFVDEGMRCFRSVLADKADKDGKASPPSADSLPMHVVPGETGSPRAAVALSNWERDTSPMRPLLTAQSDTVSTFHGADKVADPLPLTFFEPGFPMPLDTEDFEEIRILSNDINRTVSELIEANSLVDEVPADSIRLSGDE